MEENRSTSEHVLRLSGYYNHLNQVIIIPRHFEYMLTDRTILLHLAAVELIGDFISLNPGICLKILTSTPGTSHMVHDVQNVFEVPILSR